MAFDSYIAAATFLLSLLGAIVSAVFWILRTRREKKGIKLILKKFGRNTPFINRINFDGNGEASVGAVAMWVQVHLYNSSSKPLLVTEIRAYEEGAEPRPIIDFPVQELNSLQRDHIPKNPLEIPFTIESGRGVSLFFLCQVDVPSKVGDVLFRLYGEVAKGTESFQTISEKFYKRREEMKKFFRDDPRFNRGLGVVLTDIKMASATIYRPMLFKRPEGLVFEPYFGTLPPDATLDILAELSEADADMPDSKVGALTTSWTKYHFDVVTGDDRCFRTSIDTDGQALWFLRWNAVEDQV